MTGTGESLADAHIHMNTHMEAGGATLVFTVLWYYPILVTWPRASSSLREGGGIDTPLRGWGETREREPNPAQASSFFLFFLFFSNTQTLNPSANMSHSNKHACLRPRSDGFQRLCSVPWLHTTVRAAFSGRHRKTTAVKDSTAYITLSSA